MSVTPPAETGLSPATQAEVERVRASGALGAGGRLVELFDYLVSRSAEDRSPKEAEIALAVFGKQDADSLRDDPVARVYIHRLRKRLDDFYLREGVASSVRLDIPKGDYRIVSRSTEEKAPALLAEPEAVGAAPAPTPEVQRKRVGVLIAAAAIAVAANVAAWAVFVGGRPAPEREITSTSVWAGMAESERPLLVVVGDYYLFGEYEKATELKRLIHDFNIHSKDELVESLRGDPSGFDRYGDVAMQYLPASAAFALADLAPLLRGERNVQVQLASELSSDRLKTDDIIYVGLLNGLGPLRDPVFAQSRYGFGESYDQIIDNDTGKSYTSEAFLAAPSDTMYRDYGFFSTFHGPSGNRIAIISGSRDTAVMGVAESLTKLKALDEIAERSGNAADFEMLFEVKGQKHINLETRPVSSYPMDSASIWTGANANTTSFPVK